MFRESKKVMTKILAGSFKRHHNKYIYLFDKRKQKNSDKLYRYVESYVKKHHSDVMGDVLMNTFKVTFESYFNGTIDRNSIYKMFHFKSEVAYNIFRELEITVGYYGSDYVDGEKSYSGFLFGTFFRDIPESKAIPKLLRIQAKLYHDIYCRDWLKHVAFLMVHKKDI